MEAKVLGLLIAGGRGLQSTHEALGASERVKAAAREMEERYEDLKSQMNPDAQAALDKSKLQALSEGAGLPKELVLSIFYLRHSSQMIGVPMLQASAFSTAEVFEKVYRDGSKVKVGRFMNPDGSWAPLPVSTKSVGKGVFIHPAAELGENGEIGNNVHIDKVRLGKDYSIGDNTEIWHETVFDEGLKLGKYNRIGAWITAGKYFVAGDYFRAGDGAKFLGDHIEFLPYGNVGDLATVKGLNSFPKYFIVENNQVVEDNQFRKVTTA